MLYGRNPSDQFSRRPWNEDGANSEETFQGGVPVPIVYPMLSLGANLILRVKTNLIFSFKIDAYNLFFELISYLLYFLI